MRRIITVVTVALVMALMMLLVGPASAIDPNASSRACVGADASSEAGPELGAAVSGAAKELHPLGLTFFALFATTCELPSEEG